VEEFRIGDRVVWVPTVLERRIPSHRGVIRAVHLGHVEVEWDVTAFVRAPRTTWPPLKRVRKLNVLDLMAEGL